MDRRGVSGPHPWWKNEKQGSPTLPLTCPYAMPKQHMGRRSMIRMRWVGAFLIVLAANLMCLLEWHNINAWVHAGMP